MKTNWVSLSVRAFGAFVLSGTLYVIILEKTHINAMRRTKRLKSFCRTKISADTADHYIIYLLGYRLL